jgi:hypothetical protein
MIEAMSLHKGHRWSKWASDSPENPRNKGGSQNGIGQGLADLIEIAADR